MANLFSPLTIKSVQLRNRIVVSPMCEYSSQDGFANDWHLVHLGSRAVGGAGLVLTEAAAVSPEGRISPEDLGIWKDEHVVFLKRITDFIHAQGAVAGIQLAHAGRKGGTSAPWKGGEYLAKEDGGWQAIAPSALPFKEGQPVPAEMSKEDIARVVADFKAAAKRALDAGFRIIELHAAHGYLINEFLSPLSNNRTDEYGGSFENRTQFLYEVLEAVQQVWPANLPIFVRISATDWAAGGWDTEDSIKLAHQLKLKGADLIDCSTGGNVAGVKIPVGPMYQVEYAAVVKKATGILTGAVGMITSSVEAEGIIAKEEADLVFMARELLRNPYFPLEAAFELHADVQWPKQYERAKKKHV